MFDKTQSGMSHDTVTVWKALLQELASAATNQWQLCPLQGSSGELEVGTVKLAKILQETRALTKAQNTNE